MPPGPFPRGNASSRRSRWATAGSSRAPPSTGRCAGSTEPGARRPLRLAFPPPAALARRAMAAAIFWAAMALVVYVYAGYPCLIFLLARLRPRPVRKAPVLPTVSFIIAAYNEERVIAAKLENTFALDYPAERLEVMAVSDGSTDATEEIVRTRFAGRVKLLALPRQGKTLAQNQAVAVATGEIVVFSDATTVYQPESLRALVANLSDTNVGCVTGTTIYAN